MNKEQLIALGLTDEQAQQVVDGFGTMVPKTRLDDKIKELKTANDTIVERDTQLEELKPKAAGNEALLQQIQQLQNDNKTATEKYQSELTEQQRAFALDSALKDAKVHNPKSVKALLDMEKIKLNGEALEGLMEQLEALKQSDAYLFAGEQQQQQPPSWSNGEHTPPGTPTDAESWMAAFK
ncbi:phage scaffolding protein [Lysinibacillus sp. RS5]|uniref:phage scaffolding protein n=1 Tax=unclassified Lysinibacillus TaxID=2636778 RepID=UPI0035BEA483